VSLILEDPIKYKEMRDRFQKEDEDTLKNTITLMRNMSDSEIEEFLEFLGKFFHRIRLNNNMTLRSFCIKYNLSSVAVANIERGLSLPNLDLMDIYLRDDIKEKRMTQEKIVMLRKQIDCCDETLVKILSQRFKYVSDIFDIKKEENMLTVDLDRFYEIVHNSRKIAIKESINPDLIEEILNTIHKYSIKFINDKITNITL